MSTIVAVLMSPLDGLAWNSGNESIFTCATSAKAFFTSLSDSRFLAHPKVLKNQKTRLEHFTRKHFTQTHHPSTAHSYPARRFLNGQFNGEGPGDASTLVRYLDAHGVIVTMICRSDRNRCGGSAFGRSIERVPEEIQEDLLNIIGMRADERQRFQVENDTDGAAAKLIGHPVDRLIDDAVDIGRLLHRVLPGDVQEVLRNGR